MATIQPTGEKLMQILQGAMGVAASGPMKREDVLGFGQGYLDQRAGRNALLQGTVSASLTPRQNLGAIEMPEDVLLEQSAEIAMDLMSGQVPEDVRKYVEQVSSELTAQGGLGPSQAAINVTARDLGLTSLEMQQQGLSAAQNTYQLALGREEISTKREVFDEQIKFSYAQLGAQMNQWEDQFANLMNERDIDYRRLELAGFELLSKNTIAAQELYANLVQANSQAAIEGLQGNLDQIGSNVDAMNQMILRSMGL